MANVNLNNIFKKLNIGYNQQTSNVDGDIIIPKEKPSIYSDIKLDLEFKEYSSNILNSKNTSEDINLIINEESVIQSVKNILNTKYTDRLLNPEININMSDYLFENLSEAKAFFIGYDLQQLIPAYEPRVKVSNIRVTAYYNSSTYEISMTITIPSLNKNVKLSSILSIEGFTFE